MSKFNLKIILFISLNGFQPKVVKLKILYILKHFSQNMYLLFGVQYKNILSWCH